MPDTRLIASRYATHPFALLAALSTPVPLAADALVVLLAVSVTPHSACSPAVLLYVAVVASAEPGARFTTYVASFAVMPQNGSPSAVPICVNTIWSAVGSLPVLLVYAAWSLAASNQPLTVSEESDIPAMRALAARSSVVTSSSCCV